MSVLLRKLFGSCMEEADAGDGGSAGSGASDNGAGSADGGDGGSASAAGDKTAPAAKSGDDKGGKSGDTSGDKGSAKIGDDKTTPWPDDWRQRASKGDEALLKRFERFASPEAAMEALIASQNRIRSGELKASLPKNAKPEEVAEWRKENGIPEAPEKYDLTFKNGLVIGDEDKPIVDGFLKTAHELNLNNEQVKPVVEWYYKEQERQSAERERVDEEQRVQTLDALNAEWGNEFRRNINSVEGVLNMFPEGVRDQLKGGRLADGTAIFNNPEVIRAWAAIARELNPAGTLVPAGSGDAMKSTEDEISSIEKTMRENRTAYNKDEKMQSRYRELLVAREKMQSRKS